MKTKRKSVVVVDVDGVLADFWNVYSKKFGISSGYEIESTPEQREFWTNPPYDFWFNLPRITHPKWFYSAVEGYQVVFLTNCSHAKARMDWLNLNGFMGDGNLLWVNAPGTSKKDVLRFLDPVMFIDDFGKNIEEAEELGIKSLIKFDNENPEQEWKRIKEILQ